MLSDESRLGFTKLHCSYMCVMSILVQVLNYLLMEAFMPNYLAFTCLFCHYF